VSDSPVHVAKIDTACKSNISIFRVMMKTIKKRLNRYAKYILMGWGSCLFLELTFVFFTSDKQSP
jgi:hypothetical protein